MLVAVQGWGGPFGVVRWCLSRLLLIDPEFLISRPMLSNRTEKEEEVTPSLAL
jgi:hypothetical protein